MRQEFYPLISTEIKRIETFPYGRFFIFLCKAALQITVTLCSFKIYVMNFQPILLGVLGTQEIIIIAIIILLLFGGRKIPELMKGLGKGIREFNDAKNTVRKEIEESSTTPPADANQPKQ